MDFSFRERDRRPRNEDLARDSGRRSSLQHAEAHRDFSRARGDAAALRAYPAHSESRRIKNEQARRNSTITRSRTCARRCKPAKAKSTRLTNCLLIAGSILLKISIMIRRAWRNILPARTSYGLKQFAKH